MKYHDVPIELAKRLETAKALRAKHDQEITEFYKELQKLLDDNPEIYQYGVENSMSYQSGNTLIDIEDTLPQHGPREFWLPSSWEQC